MKGIVVDVQGPIPTPMSIVHMILKGIRRQGSPSWVNRSRKRPDEKSHRPHSPGTERQRTHMCFKNNLFALWMPPLYNHHKLYVFTSNI